MEADLSKSSDAPAAQIGPSVAIHLNGEPRQIRATTLAAWIEEVGYGAQRVATAINGDFVPTRAREATRLKSGDHVEIVAPRQGG